MEPIYDNGNVRSRCPDCDGAVTTFEFRSSSKEYGYVTIKKDHKFAGSLYNQIIYRLLRCAGCGRGGLAKVRVNDNPSVNVLEWMYPNTIETLNLPEETPDDIVKEFREAELCASNGAYRGASALLRSALEKILKENGYNENNLKMNINKANKDGILTDARKNKAHEDVRVLGNDILHEAWIKISEEQFSKCHKYVQRISEDFYDDRDAVKKILNKKETTSTEPTDKTVEESHTTEDS